MNIAEGFPRRAFTVDDISRMMEAGVLGEDENFELIEGDILVSAAKHIGHDGIKNALTMALARSAPAGVFVAIECSLQLAKDILVEPDITVISQSVYAANRKSFARPNPEDVHLLIEIAASSLAYDRRIKRVSTRGMESRNIGSSTPTSGSLSCTATRAARPGPRSSSMDRRTR